jgi:hypothetical protein
MAESDFNDELRLAQMEVSTPITLTNGIGTLPADYIAWRRVLTQDNPVRVLEWADPSWAEDHYYAIAPQPSWHFTITGSTLKTYPTSVPNLTLLYYQRIPPLSSNQQLAAGPQTASLFLRLWFMPPRSWMMMTDAGRGNAQGRNGLAAADRLRGPLWQGVQRPPGSTMTDKSCLFQQRDHRGAGGHPGHPAGLSRRRSGQASGPRRQPS